MPGKFPVHFQSFPRAKQAIPVHSLPIPTRKLCRECSLYTSIHSFSRAKPATPVHSHPNSNSLRKPCREKSPYTSTPFQDLGRQSLYTLPTNSFWKLSRTNMYTSTFKF